MQAQIAEIERWNESESDEMERSTATIRLPIFHRWELESIAISRRMYGSVLLLYSPLLRRFTSCFTLRIVDEKIVPKAPPFDGDLMSGSTNQAYVSSKQCSSAPDITVSDFDSADDDQHIYSSLDWY